MNLEARKPGKEAGVSLWRWLALLTLPVYLLDQATKWAVLTRLEVDTASVPVIPGFFTLVHWRNTGAAFSFMSDSNGFFIGLSAVALVVLGVLAWRGKFQGNLGRAGWALLLAGILGNLTDRLAHGSVVDFLLFDLHVPLGFFPNPWPAFNIADSSIFCAAALFLWQAFREPEANA
jgi:signal peptidase II